MKRRPKVRRIKPGARRAAAGRRSKRASYELGYRFGYNSGYDKGYHTGLSIDRETFVSSFEGTSIVIPTFNQGELLRQSLRVSASIPRSRMKSS